MRNSVVEAQMELQMNISRPKSRKRMLEGQQSTPGYRFSNWMDSRQLKNQRSKLQKYLSLKLRNPHTPLRSFNRATKLVVSYYLSKRTRICASKIRHLNNPLTSVNFRISGAKSQLLTLKTQHLEITSWGLRPSTIF